MNPVRTAWLIFAFLVALFIVAPLSAAPRAENERECVIVADMAVVARALAEERIAQAVAEPIMRRIYKVDSSPRGQEMMRAIIRAAYVRKDSAAAFASEVHVACMTTGGNLDRVLGVAL